MVSGIELPWEQDNNTDNVFAWLRPLNEPACLAFNLVVESMIENPNMHQHERKFVHVLGRAFPRAGSVSESDDQAEQEEADQPQIVGAFKFSTAVLPREPSSGWFIGTGYHKPEVDVVIGPPGPDWKENKILGKHARLFIHKESCQTTVEALHGMEVTGTTGLKHIGPKFSSPAKVLEDLHLVHFGRCTYVFEQGDAIVNGNFEDSLEEFMHVHHSRQWKAHLSLSAPSTAAYHTLNEFTYVPGAFAVGTFGEVTVGWAQDGSAVAIKRIKKPNEIKLDQHMTIMELIGEHANVLRLIFVSRNIEQKIPAIYCVYSPLALFSLEDVIESHFLNVPAQNALLIQYLRGLVYLHDTKGIMHRDIKPSNLGVVSFNPLKGVILDLDAATTETLSDDHGKGTIAYLAPEVIDLKMGTTKDLEKYGQPVDVWALGISFFEVLLGRRLDWNRFDDWQTRGASLPKTNITDFVLESRLSRFRLTTGMLKAKNEERRRYINLLESMTAYKARDRPSASQALDNAEKLARYGGEAKVSERNPAHGVKRKSGENR